MCGCKQETCLGNYSCFHRHTGPLLFKTPVLEQLREEVGTNDD